MAFLNFSKWTITRRIVLFATLLVATSTIVLTAFFVQDEQALFRDALEDQALTLLNTLRFASDNELIMLDIATLQNFADELDTAQVTTRFYTGDGRLVASNHPDETNLFSFDADVNGSRYITLRTPQLSWDENHLIAAQSVPVGEQIVGAVSVEFSTAPLQQKIASIRNVAVLILMATIVIGWMTSIFIGRSITRPIHNLIDATLHVTDGIYENRIQLKEQGTPEVNQLVSAFDNLINKTIEKRTAEIEKTAAQERENSRLKDEFIAVMSHELRTPLNAIIGFLGIIQKRANLDEKNAHRLSRVRANAERLLSLINDILDVSRIEAGRMQVVEAPMKVAPFFHNVQSQMAVLAEDKGLDFQVSISSDMPEELISDENLLSKIVINLLGNAFKFTDSGSVSLTVHSNGDDWTIAVRDTGIGIPYHMQDVIFQRFAQVDSSSKRKHDGTGLGLAIVHSLVKELGGTISLKSKPEKGSTFTAKLPLKVAQQSILMQEL